MGAFSISLAVQDLAASRDFYAKLGFEPVGGNAGQNWLVLRNGSVTIGLFCGMFERNLLTFNPGWDARCEPLTDFTDVRVLQRRLEASGVTPVKRADDPGSGPDSFVVVDPDGNPVLIDQHVDGPAGERAR